MELSYMGKLFLSILIFAPGLILLVTAVFLTMLMMLEKWGVFGRAAVPERKARGGNPAAGPIVDELKELVEEQQRDEQHVRKVG